MDQTVGRSIARVDRGPPLFSGVVPRSNKLVLLAIRRNGRVDAAMAGIVAHAVNATHFRM